MAAGLSELKLTLVCCYGTAGCPFVIAREHRNLTGTCKASDTSMPATSDNRAANVQGASVVWHFCCWQYPPCGLNIRVHPVVLTLDASCLGRRAGSEAVRMANLAGSVVCGACLDTLLNPG